MFVKAPPAFPYVNLRTTSLGETEKEGALGPKAPYSCSFKISSRAASPPPEIKLTESDPDLP